MDIRILTTADDFALWADFVKKTPQGSLWQAQEWKEYQEALGCETRVYGYFDKLSMTAAALVIIDKTAGNLATWEIPRGPIVEEGREENVEGSALIDHIIDDAKKERVLCVFLSPTKPLPSTLYPLVPSHRHSQPEATRILDLTLDPEALLQQMKPKGRYNIRLAQRHDIEVRESNDVAAFHALLKRTGQRDRFGIHPLRHYEAFLTRLPGAFLLMAYHRGDEPIAGLLGVAYGTTGIYYYGASDERHRSFMAPYVLQWEAMRLCKERGCTRYDLLGVAPPNAGADHAWAGITNFKEKFGGTLVTYPPEQHAVLRPMAWKLLRLKRKLLG